MAIYIFGAKRCKFCQKQKDLMKETFDEKDWNYIDVVENEDGLKIASDINIDSIPGILVIDKNGKVLLNHSGTMLPDRIAYIASSCKSIPFHIKDKKLVMSNNKKRLLLSFNPKLNKDDVIEAITYSGEKICDIKIMSSENISLNEYDLPNIEKLNYLKRSGNKEDAWLIAFKRK
jgi:hypothetical protein